MIKSMTAFARADLSSEDLSVSIEIRGYNSRYLDLAIKMPQQYAAIEDKLRRAIAEHVSRGRMELKVTILDVSISGETFIVNEAMAAAYHDALKKLKTSLNMDMDIPFEIVAKKNGVIEAADIDIDTERIWKIACECLLQALNSFEAMKTTEGRAIEADLKARLAFIEGCISDIEEHSSDLLPYYQEKLTERIHALTNGLVEIDPARVAQESAFIADRSDISEEIVRAKSHLNQFRQLIDEPSPSGRQLNFLLQEFNREFNTMGSKAGKARIAHVVVSAKTELEKIREQIQNVE